MVNRRTSTACKSRQRGDIRYDVKFGALTPAYANGCGATGRSVPALRRTGDVNGGERLRLFGGDLGAADEGGGFIDD